jgi:hypothetical protein
MSNPEPKESFGSFLPICLLAVSLALLLSWDLYATVIQRSNGNRLLEQQALQLSQASQLEEKLKAMMSDLLVLALSDADAKAVVKKYKITSSAPVAPSTAAEPKKGDQ